MKERKTGGNIGNLLFVFVIVFDGKVACLDLPVADLSSAEGKLMLQMFSAFAEFERNRIRERTKEGLERAKAQGKKLGRPEAHNTTALVQAKKSEGLSQSKTAEVLGLGIATVKRHWNKLNFCIN
jgi:putative DNA-invertase from lambdoid prophage Rac